MVEFICLEDVEGLQTMPQHCHVYKSGLLYQSPSRAKAVFCNKDLEL